MSDNAWIEAVRDGVQTRLAQYFADKRQEAEGISPESLALVEAVEALTMRGGKRLRALVLVAAYRALSGRAPMPTCASLCAALELLQSYLLIHDDWMDGDAERRGGPAVHIALEQRYGSRHLGESLAILAGDLGAVYALELFADAPFSPARQAEALQYFLRIHKEVFFGQQLDLLQSSDVERMHQLKTGSYTVRGPMHLGALLADASPAQLEALDAFSRPLGQAFQLRDDLLGTFADQGIGKPIGNDLRAGKHTAVIAAAVKVLEPAQKAELDAVLGRADASDAQVREVTTMLEAAGVRQTVEAQLATLMRQAESVLQQGVFDSEQQPLLWQAAQLLVQRWF
ncbi:MAG: polyprenyl synthetase family protein [Polyangiales bacterium]